jgi:hypothetical protein
MITRHPIAPEVQAAAKQAWLESFPNYLNPPVSFQTADETDEYVVVAVSNRDPGMVAYIRVTRNGNVATLVAEDQLKYRPRNLK